MDLDLDVRPEDLVTITDGDGQSIDCVVVATIEYMDREYAMLCDHHHQLASYEATEINLYLFGWSSDDEGNEIFIPIEDDDVYEAVKVIFTALMEEHADGYVPTEEAEG